jgi:hypothetical protein
MQKGNINSMEKENILRAVLAEHKVLTDEIRQIFQQQIWFYYISVGFIAIIMGYIITQKVYDAFLCIPLFITPLLYGYIRQWAALTIIGNYVRDVIEKEKITEIIGFRNNEATNHERYWMGWEHYYFEKSSAPIFDIFRVTVSAIIILFLPSLLYCILCIISSISSLSFLTLDMYSKIPIPFHVLISIFYVFLVFAIIKISKKLIRT